MRRIRVPFAWGAACATLVTMLLVIAPVRSQRIDKPVLYGGEVHGFVAVEMKSRQRPVRIRLPQARVFLKNTRTGEIFGPTPTDMHGWFHTEKVPKGDYQVCAETDTIARRCDDKPWTLGSDAVVLPTDFLLIPRRAVYGRVLLGDSTPCYGEDVTFRPTIVTNVRLADPDTRKQLSHVRHDGWAKRHILAIA